MVNNIISGFIAEMEKIAWGIPRHYPDAITTDKGMLKEVMALAGGDKKLLRELKKENKQSKMEKMANFLDKSSKAGDLATKKFVEQKNILRNKFSNKTISQEMFLSKLKKLNDEYKNKFGDWVHHGNPYWEKYTGEKTAMKKIAGVKDFLKAFKKKPTFAQSIKETLPWAISRGVTGGLSTLAIGLTMSKAIKEMDKKDKGKEKTLKEKMKTLIPVAATGTVTGLGKGIVEKGIENLAKAILKVK